jgi:hypothetical protein
MRAMWCFIASVRFACFFRAARLPTAARFFARNLSHSLHQKDEDRSTRPHPASGVLDVPRHHRA